MACLVGKLFCGLLVAYSGVQASPTIPGIQAAFDREALVADGKHDRDLKITGLDCTQEQDSKYFCQVNFIRAEQHSGQVYLDAALIEQKGDGDWKLLKGLCRRLL